MQLPLTALLQKLLRSRHLLLWRRRISGYYIPTVFRVSDYYSFMHLNTPPALARKDALAPFRVLEAIDAIAGFALWRRRRLWCAKHQLGMVSRETLGLN